MKTSTKQYIFSELQAKAKATLELAEKLDTEGIYIFAKKAIVPVVRGIETIAEVCDTPVHTENVTEGKSKIAIKRVSWFGVVFEQRTYVTEVETYGL